MSEWKPIESAPKDGTQVLLWVPLRYAEGRGRVEIGSFRVDDGFTGNEEPEWLDNSYDDFSTGYAANPLAPTHWQPLPPPPGSET